MRFADCDSATPQPTLLKPGCMQQECLWLAVEVFFLPALGLQKDGSLRGALLFMGVSATMIEFDPPIALDVLLERGDAHATVEKGVEVSGRRLLDLDDTEERRTVAILLVRRVAPHARRPDFDPELAAAQIFDASGGECREFGAQPRLAG